MSDPTLEPRYQHTSEELRYVADILDALNAHPDGLNGVGFGGTLELFWCDRLMGWIKQYDPEAFDSWCYFAASTTMKEDEP